MLHVENVVEVLIDLDGCFTTGPTIRIAHLKLNPIIDCIRVGRVMGIAYRRVMIAAYTRTRVLIVAITTKICLFTAVPIRIIVTNIITATVTPDEHIIVTGFADVLITIFRMCTHPTVDFATFIASPVSVVIALRADVNSVVSVIVVEDVFISRLNNLTTMSTNRPLFSFIVFFHNKPPMLVVWVKVLPIKPDDVDCTDKGENLNMKIPIYALL
jgi:hypothetical protein